MNLHPDIAAVLEGRAQYAVITGDCLAVLPTLPAGFERSVPRELAAKIERVRQTEADAEEAEGRSV